MAAKPKAAAPAGDVSLVAVEPIRHDGADVAPGETFAVSPEAAEALVNSGAAKAAESQGIPADKSAI